MVAWRAENRDRIKAINHRYYMRNKGFLNKTRSRPWNKENIIRWILNGEQKYIDMMIRVLRPHKDKLIGLDKKYEGSSTDRITMKDLQRGVDAFKK